MDQTTVLFQTYFFLFFALWDLTARNLKSGAARIYRPASDEGPRETCPFPGLITRPHPTPDNSGCWAVVLSGKLANSRAGRDCRSKVPAPMEASSSRRKLRASKLTSVADSQAIPHALLRETSRETNRFR